MESLDELLQQLGFGGVTRNRAGQIVTNTNDVIPVATAGLADTLYGAGRGTLAGTAAIGGIPGDINQMYVNRFGALFPSQPAPPTSEQISQAVKRAVPPLNLSRDNTGRVATSLGENVVSPMVAPEALLGAARATKGLPVGMSIKEVKPVAGLMEAAPDLSYKGSHTPPNAKVYGATIDNLGGIMPVDVYSSKGTRLYGLGNPEVDSQWFAAAYKAKGKPDADVTVYRAVPKGVKSINNGDWVTTSKTYAKDHGENALNGEYEIVSKKVKAKTLSSEGYPYEFGYHE